MEIPNLQGVTESIPAKNSESSGTETRRNAEYRDARSSRVADYLLSSLAKDDPLQANLGSINSGLMKITYDLEECLTELLSDGPLTAERLQQISPALSTYLNLTRQVRCFAEIELRAGEAQRPKRSKPRGGKGCVDGPSLKSDGQSEDSEF